MSINKERLADIVAKLRKERDELRLKVHLGTMEAKEEWKHLEGKWQALESRLTEAGQGAAEKAREARAKAALVAHELEAAYGQFREGRIVD